MLILLINRILGNNVEKYSNYENGFNFENKPLEKIYLIINGYNPEYMYNWRVIDNIYIFFLYILAFGISCASAYLSFNCNWSGFDNNIIFKVLFSFVSFMLGPIYLIYYFIFNYLGKMC
jgi:hypothetical protein